MPSTLVQKHNWLLLACRYLCKNITGYNFLAGVYANATTCLQVLVQKHNWILFSGRYLCKNITGYNFLAGVCANIFGYYLLAGVSAKNITAQLMHYQHVLDCY